MIQRGKIIKLDVRNKFKAEYEAAGKELVAVEAFSDDANTDFQAQINSMKNAGADFVFLPIYYTPASNILIQADKIGYAPTWFGGDGMDGILTLEGFDTALAEGVILLTPYSADDDSALNQSFVAKYQEKYGDLYNLEATPAESTTYRFAKHDKEQYPDIITANMNGTPYYTNSSHLPVGFSDDVFSALDIQDELQTLYTSGTVFHAFLGEKLPDWKAASNLVRKIAENYKLPYYTMSPTYSVCKDHGYLSGEQYVCPHCGQKAEVYSRITGYYRPVQNWNDGKAQEFKDRKVYDIGHSRLTHSGPVAVTAPEKPAAAEAARELPDVEAAREIKTGVNNRAILFVSATCPNCRLAISMLEKAGFLFKKVLATDHPELTNQYGVKQAPTLVVLGPDGNYTKYRGVSEIKGMLTEKQAV